MSELLTQIEVGAESENVFFSSDLIRIDSVLSKFSFSLLQSIHNFYLKNAIMHTDSGVQMVRTARINKLSVVSKRLAGD